MGNVNKCKALETIGKGGDNFITKVVGNCTDADDLRCGVYASPRECYLDKIEVEEEVAKNLRAILTSDLNLTVEEAKQIMGDEFVRRLAAEDESPRQLETKNSCKQECES